MTIAACYLTPEGVVLGADSTTSGSFFPGGFHYFNHNQKLFELGEDGSVGILTWGMGSLGNKSHRTFFAMLADDLQRMPARDVEEIAARFVDLYWKEFGAFVAPFLRLFNGLGLKVPFDASANPPPPNSRTEQEEQVYKQLKESILPSFVVGFCIAGYVLPSREASAYEIVFDAFAGMPTPQPLSMNSPYFWGVPNMIKRLIDGHDPHLKTTILGSSKWTGTEQELTDLLKDFALRPAILPIREAVDFVHVSILSTVKALKFSNLTQVCGGPIEIAVVTSDRKFRWVRHKPWDMAITEGDPT